MTRLLLTLLMHLTLLASVAQDRKTVSLREDYGLTELQSRTQVKNLFSTQAAAQAKYPRAYADWIARGGTAASFMELSAFDAAASDAVWRGNGGTGVVGQWPDSNNDIIIGQGTFHQYTTLRLGGGRLIGEGCNWTDVGSTSMATMLVVGHDRWIGSGDRVQIIIGPWGQTGKYIRGGGIDEMTLDGALHVAPAGVRTVGIRAWKTTETQRHGTIRIERHTVGIEINDHAPSKWGVISVSGCVEAGVKIIGSWGATIDIDIISGDDNGRMVHVVGGFGGVAGGGIRIGTIKREAGLRSTADFGPHRGHIIADLTGRCRLSIDNVWGFNGASIKSDAAFVVRPSDGHRILLNVGVFGLQGFANLIHQTAGSGVQGRAWTAGGLRDGVGLTYDSGENGGTVRVNSAVQSATTRTCTDALGWTTGTAWPNGSTCTPQWQDVGYGGTAPPPPPPPTACTGWTYTVTATCPDGTWSARTAVGIPDGCTGTPPPDSLSRTCAAPPPPPPLGGIDPASVLVLLNSADGARTIQQTYGGDGRRASISYAGSQATAQAYAQAWGIPAGNIITVNAGTADACPTTTVNTIRSAIAAKATAQHQYIIIAWFAPSRTHGGQSITSAITFGNRDPRNLTVSPLENYSGLTPFTDKGVRPSMWLGTQNYIRRDAHGKADAAHIYSVAAKDTPSSGNVRGTSRVSQMQTVAQRPDATLFDVRGSTAFSGGGDVRNSLTNQLFTLMGATKQRVAASFGSCYVCWGSTDTERVPGYYADHVTSHGGNMPHGVDATPLTYWLDAGAGATACTVVEPAQSRSGHSPWSLQEQFVRITTFVPLYLQGLPHVVSVWASVKCPDRLLIAGDGLCAPYYR